MQLTFNENELVTVYAANQWLSTSTGIATGHGIDIY
jgi:hypothetical protein